MGLWVLKPEFDTGVVTCINGVFPISWVVLCHTVLHQRLVLLTIQDMKFTTVLTYVSAFCSAVRIPAYLRRIISNADTSRQMPCTSAPPPTTPSQNPNGKSKSRPTRPSSPAAPSRKSARRPCGTTPTGTRSTCTLRRPRPKQRPNERSSTRRTWTSASPATLTPSTSSAAGAGRASSGLRLCIALSIYMVCRGGR
ncbi:hypothetical protein BDW62DRAFT_86216 [Aspergillus aurantiobrunneus]